MNESIAMLAGREKLALARAGMKPLPKIAHIALGDGGMSGGLPVIPENDMTELFHETYRKQLSRVTLVSSTTAQYAIMLEKSECEGMIFNEMGLIDEEGTLIAVKTFLPSQKDGSMRLEFTMDDEF